MKRFVGVLLVLVLASVSCVDRIDFKTGDKGALAVVVEGVISDQPGPYEVKVSRTYDVEAKSSVKVPLSVRSLTISDNVGNSENLVRMQEGIYQTQLGGMKGVVGRAYKLRVELLDGRIYESVPDTLYPSGGVEKVYHEFVAEKKDGEGTEYGFDLYFDSKAADQKNFRFMWKRIATYQIETNPELHDETCGQGRCPRPLPCSSYAVVNGALSYVGLCNCCTCWVNMFNEIPIVSDDELVDNGEFTKVSAGQIPLTRWTFMYKVHVEVQQLSLSPKAFEFWSAVKAQMEGTESLFQPLTGKIEGNFVQMAGEEAPLVGLFYATSIKKNSTFIRRTDLPSEGMIPPPDLPFTDSCLKFANSTSVKPLFWDQ